MIQEIVDSVQNLFGTRKIRQKPRILSKDEHNIDIEKVSPFAISVCKKLRDAGFKAFIVGGAVRDLLINHTPKDFDVATDATPEQVKKITKRAIIIGRRFRLVHVTRNAETIEVATFRGLRQEGVEKDSFGRVTDDNVYGEQYEDAARRDFTVNAMYYDPLTEEVYDYHNGLLDIRKKRIRMIGDPEVRYREDPVRILRAIRIAAKLGFKIDPKTSKPMKEMQSLLLAVPEARLFDEVMKMLMSGASVQCFELLTRYGINEKIPLLEKFLAANDDPFLYKALEKSDARVSHGKSISQSFIFAILLWSNVKKRIKELEENKPESLTVNRMWQEAIRSVVDSSDANGIQNRFIRDMEDIWRLQPKLERRESATVMKILDHPRFRAAYDFFLIRASSGEVSHELADWWTAFEEASPEDRLEMRRELSNRPRTVLGEKKKRRRTRKRKPSSKVIDGSVQAVSATEFEAPEIEKEDRKNEPEQAVSIQSKTAGVDNAKEVLQKQVDNVRQVIQELRKEKIGTPRTGVRRKRATSALLTPRKS